jgi:2-polyprenyl-3-methyl-5-hydroxy-6-metoxy-1,4-benzoquinol methylase
MPRKAASIDSAAVPVGNAFDKYGSRNPLFRRLVRRFEADLGGLFEAVDPTSILDFGCGEGVLTERWAVQHSSVRVVGVDLEHPVLLNEWQHRRRPNLEFRIHDDGPLQFAAAEFDLVAAVEVLEHVRDPTAVLAELRRVARRALVVSVPREPLWRTLNVLRGAYLRDLGDTPGHVNHWSRDGVVALLSGFGRIEQVRTPLPWVQVLVDVR